MKKILMALLLLLAGAGAASASTQESVKRVLFLGDSMTGWLAERMEAYGAANGFEVSVVIWDGSTLQKWTRSGRIPTFLRQYKPEVVMVCLGLNELLVRDPGARMASPLEAFKKQLGGIPFVWIGPPTWPGKGSGTAFNEWMAHHMGANGHYFCSEKLKLSRQSASNPHPTRQACAQWMDAIVHWLPSTSLGFPQHFKAPASDMKRPKNYLYRRMRQTL